MTGADRLLLAPWLVFAAGLVAIGFGLLNSRGALSRRVSGWRALSRRIVRHRGSRR